MRKNNLDASLMASDADLAADPASAPVAPGSKRKQVAAVFGEEVSIALRTIALSRGVSLKQVMAESFRAFLASHGHPVPSELLDTPLAPAPATAPAPTPRRRRQPNPDRVAAARMRGAPGRDER